MALCDINGWPTPEREVVFHRAGVVYEKQRKFRLDFFFRDYGLAVECDGGTFRPNTGHTSPLGLEADHTKDFLAFMQDIIVLRLTEITFRNKEVELRVEAALRKRGWCGGNEQCD